MRSRVTSETDWLGLKETFCARLKHTDGDCTHSHTWTAVFYSDGWLPVCRVFSPYSTSHPLCSGGFILKRHVSYSFNVSVKLPSVISVKPTQCNAADLCRHHVHYVVNVSCGNKVDGTNVEMNLCWRKLGGFCNYSKKTTENIYHIYTFLCVLLIIYRWSGWWWRSLRASVCTGSLFFQLRPNRLKQEETSDFIHRKQQISVFNWLQVYRIINYSWFNLWVQR